MSTNYPGNNSGEYPSNYQNTGPQDFPYSEYPPLPVPIQMPAPVPARRKSYAGRVIIIVLVLVAIGLGVLRYYGPVLVSQSFINDVYSYKSADALNLICPAEQAQVQGELQSIGLLSLFQLNIDTSNLSYSIQSESLTDATVTVTGSISAYSIASSNVNGILTLQTNGLWWCISSQTNGPTS